MFYGLLYGYSKERAFLITDIERNFFQKIEHLNKNLFNHRFDLSQRRYFFIYINICDKLG